MTNKHNTAPTVAVAGLTPNQIETLAREKWNAHADEHNQWGELGQDEKCAQFEQVRAIERAVLASLAPAGLETLTRYADIGDVSTGCFLTPSYQGQWVSFADVECWAASHAALLAEVRSLASHGMCHGLTADDYCSQIVAKLSGLASHAGGRDVPEGWKLVPVDPTQEMFAAARTSASGSLAEKLTMAGYWRDMIAASPTLPATPSTAAVRAAALEEAKHSPLPWKRQAKSGANQWRIVDANGRQVADINHYREEADGNMALLLAAIRALSASPSTQAGDVERDAAREPEPDMLWLADDSEVFANGPDEFANDYAGENLRPGEENTVDVDCANRASKRTMRIAVIDHGDDDHEVVWKWVDRAAMPHSADGGQ